MNKVNFHIPEVENMNKVIQERCPKCGGKVLLDKDLHDWYQECIQCGYNGDLQVVTNQAARVNIAGSAAMPVSG